MESDLNVTFLTTDDPIYLPAFFERVLGEYAEKTRAVYIVPPLYHNQNVVQAGLRFYNTFGLEGILGLMRRVLNAKLTKQSISNTCKKWKVNHGVIHDVNAEDFLVDLQKSGADLIVSVGCPQIFKKHLIELPKLGCLNIHGAVLPHYRGILPSFWMLANGENRAGVSIYYVNERIDAGDLCGQIIFDIPPKITLHQFIQQSKALSAELLLDVLKKIENGGIRKQPLNLAEGSYFSWPDPIAVKRFHATEHRLW
jgi:methionyl-tRNA formyltransferase